MNDAYYGGLAVLLLAGRLATTNDAGGEERVNSRSRARVGRAVCIVTVLCVCANIFCFLGWLLLLKPKLRYRLLTARTRKSIHCHLLGER